MLNYFFQEPPIEQAPQQVAVQQVPNAPVDELGLAMQAQAQVGNMPVAAVAVIAHHPIENEKNTIPNCTFRGG
jgi:hypothetical protein